MYEERQGETLAKVSGWTSHDKAFIFNSKLQGLALQFLNGRDALSRDEFPCEVLRQALIERFSDKLPDQGRGSGEGRKYEGVQ
jgi:hypothetical protein